MLNASSKRIASFFYTNNIIGKEEAPIYAYGIELILATILNTIVVFIIGILIGRFAETAIFLVTFAILRSFTGGYHASSHLKCLLVFIASFMANMTILWILPSNYILLFSAAATTIALLFIFLFAPVEHENKPFEEDEKRKYKIKSRFLAIVLTIVTFTGQLLCSWTSPLLLCVTLGLLTAAISIATAAIKTKIERMIDHEKF